MNKFIAGIVLLAVALIGGGMSVYTVDETEYVMVTQFGQYKYSVTEPGLRFKAPWQTVLKIDSRIISSDTPKARLLTKDKKYLVTDPITRWRVKDPYIFYKTVANELSAKRRIDDIVLSELREELASHNFGDIIGNAREPLMVSVAGETRKKVQSFGIEVVDVRIKRADLPDEVEPSVFDRMRAERKRIAQKYTAEGGEEAAKIRADTDKSRRIILATAYELEQQAKGQGDAESTKIFAAALSKDPEFYAFVRSLEAYEKSIDKKATVVLSSGSDLFRYMTNRKAD